MAKRDPIQKFQKGADSAVGGAGGLHVPGQIAQFVHHGSLIGLDDDDHPQYAELDEAETITGRWTFDDVTVRGSMRAAVFAMGEVHVDGGTLMVVEGATLYEDFVIREVEAPTTPPPLANFTSSPTSGMAPLKVTFTDTSTGTITAYAWDFENAGVTDSTAADPTHTYDTPGTYSPKLTVTSAGGTNSVTKTGSIVVAAGINELDFDASAVTWTAGQAKRAGSGPFAASLLVQDNLDMDGAAYAVDWPRIARGSQISDYWYENTGDPYQGTVLAWLRVDTIATADNRFVFDTAAISFSVNSVAELRIRGAANQNLATEDMSGWTIGTAYCCLGRWDSEQTLDGVNYACVSIDDAHTFEDNATAALGFGPQVYAYVGCSDSGDESLNGTIEGLHIFRRPLFDGTYGVDFGYAADEMASIDAGADPMTFIDARDVVLAVPLSGTGELEDAATDEAWAFPFADSILDDSFCETTYAASGWSTEGSPSAGPADTAAATDNIYHWGYEWTCDAADEGIAQTISALTPGACYALRCVAHSSDANAVRVDVYDNIGAADILTEDFGGGSDRDAPGVLETTLELPAACTEIIVKVMGTANTQVVNLHEIQCHADLWDDPGFEEGTAPTNVGTPTTSEQSAAQAHTGTYSWKVITDAASEGIQRTITTTAGRFYMATGYVYADTAGTVTVQGPTVLQDGSSTSVSSATNDAWEKLHFVFLADSTATDIQFTADAAARTFYVDDVAVIALDACTFDVNPMSEADSTDATYGLDVGGLDTCTQTVSGMSRTTGTFTWNYTPRIAAADVADFGNTTPYIAEFYGDADDYIRVYWSAANTVTLAFSDGGGVHNDTWDATAAIVAGTTYNMMVAYDEDGMILYVDETAVITISESVFFSERVGTVFWGSDSSGTSQADTYYAAYEVEVAPTADRVTDNLQNLYLFNEGAGATVADQSAVGVAEDLTIQDTGNVT